MHNDKNEKGGMERVVRGLLNHIKVKRVLAIGIGMGLRRIGWFERVLCVKSNREKRRNDLGP
jgi:hypothetical protein